MTYFYETKAGTFFIISKDLKWRIIYQDVCLGSYRSPQQAVDDLVGGHTFSPSNGVDTSLLDISDELGDWSVLKNS